ncbi:hypothetical protein TNCV_3950301 [Trichonephila clavipes]|nr:hypothetical protein TNCV_3950301 [Trichonephila clavipes]
MSRLMLCYIAICDRSLAIVQQCTRKEDLINDLKEIGEQATSKETIIELKIKLEKSAAFKDDPDFVINLLHLSVEDRQAKASARDQLTTRVRKN